MTLHAQIIQEEGKPMFAVLPYKDFEILTESLKSFDNLEDFADYMLAIKGKQEAAKWHTLDDVEKELGL
nr:prevent-host-death family protein [uncultured Arsenicibacter sp.]